MQTYNKIYARTNAQGIVTKIFSQAFVTPENTDILIDATNTDRHGANKYNVTDNNGNYNYCIVNGVLTQRDKTQDIVIQKLNELRSLREKQCFALINRGELWYNTLTDAQKVELANWYTQWLDVTKTLTPPTQPQWLK